MKRNNWRYFNNILSLGDRAVVNMLSLLSIFLFCIHIFYSIYLLEIVASCLYFYFSLNRKSVVHIYLALLLFFLVVVPYIFPAKLLLSVPYLWNLLPFLLSTLPFLLSTLVMLLFTDRKALMPWLKMGEWTKTIVVTVIGTIILTVMVLIFWASTADYLGIGQALVKQIDHLPKWVVLVILIPLSALMNALVEEVVYRGVVQTALMDSFHTLLVAIPIQSIVFSLLHYKCGFPNGIMGCGLAFLFGVMTGYLRFHTKGIMASYVVHIFADLTIGYLLIFL